MIAPRIDALFFDFDGVILNTVRSKEMAFRQIVGRHAPDRIEAIMEYYWQHGGVSRLAKFQWIWANILGRTLEESRLAALGDEFAHEVYEAVLTSGFVPGASEFLHRHHRRWPMFVISGTPEPELRRIIEARELAYFFQGVYGSPRAKAEIGREILSTYRFQPRHVWFIGDATTDRDAARQLGVRFVGIAGPHLSPYLDGDETTIADLHELERVLIRGP